MKRLTVYIAMLSSIQIGLLACNYDKCPDMQPCRPGTVPRYLKESTDGVGGKIGVSVTEQSGEISGSRTKTMKCKNECVPICGPGLKESNGTCEQENAAPNDQKQPRSANRGLSTLKTPSSFGGKVAVGLLDGKGYFFRGREYWRYDMKLDRVDPGYPVLIGDGWHGVGAGNVDAVSFLDGKGYFFRGREYWRYDMKLDRVDPGYPVPIGDGWHGVGAGSVDAVAFLNGKGYFFRGREYWRYDMKLDRVDPGYPILISNGWHGICNGWSGSC